MTSLSVYSPTPNQKYEIPSARRIAEFSSTLDSLYFPNSLNLQIVDKIKSEYGDWLIEASGHNQDLIMRVGKFMDFLRAETLTPDFTSTLTSISMGTSKDPKQSHLLACFNLARFCEYRAGLSALEIEGVIHAKLAQPNSIHDRSKQDLILECQEGERYLQVKAREGKDCRICKDTPTLRNVLRLKFSEVTKQIKALLKGSKVALN